MVKELTAKEFEEFIKDRIVMIDFFAEWCMPCIMMAPIVDELAEKFHGKVKIGKINIDENPELAKKYNVNSIPNFVIFKNKKPVEQFVGGRSIEELEEKLKGYL